MSWIVTWRGFHLNDPGSISLTCREDLQSRFVELQALLVKYQLNGRTPSPRKPVKSVSYEQKEIHQVWDTQSVSSSSCLKNIYLNHFSSLRTTSSQAFSVNAFRERYYLKPRANRRNMLANKSKHCWILMLRPFAHPAGCCSLLLGVVVQSLKPVKLLATCKRT